MNTGLGLNDDCRHAVTQLSNSYRDKEPLRYVIFGFDDKYTTITVESTGKVDKSKDPKTEYEDFIKAFTDPKLASLAVYDFPHASKAGAQTSSPILLHFNPDDSALSGMAKIKRNMNAATSLELMKNDRAFSTMKLALSGDVEDLEYADVLKRLEK